MTSADRLWTLDTQRSTGANAEISNRMSWRQIASICCYIAAGSWLAVSCLLAFMTSPAFESKEFDFFDVSWKCWLLGITSVFPLLLLLIGQSFSPVRPRKREIGIVFLSSAGGGLLILLMMTLASLDPDWQKSLPPEKHWGLYDYSTGILWLGLLSALGGTSLYAGGKDRGLRDTEQPEAGNKTRRLRLADEK